MTDILHLADPRPGFAISRADRHLTYCGRPTLSVVLWATVELADHPAGFLPQKPRCKVCIASSKARST